MGHATHVNESCHTYEQVTSRNAQVNPADEPGSENMSERNMIRGAGCVRVVALCCSVLQ